MKKILAVQIFLLFYMEALGEPLKSSTQEQGLDAALLEMSLFFVFIFIIFLYGFEKLKKSKELVQESLLNIERIVDTTIEGIAVSNKDQNIFIINKAALNIFGYTKEEFLKLKTTDIIAPDSKQLEKHTSIKADTGQYEIDLIKKDGSIFPALVSSKDILYKGEPSRIFTVIDLSLLKHTQNKLERLNNELENRVQEEVKQNLKKEKVILHQSRLAQMGELMSMIAHQWRQPLSSISLTILAMKLKLDLGKFDFESKKGRKEFKKYTYKQFNDMQNSIENISEVIDDFRSFYKPNKKSVKVNINNTINKSLNIVGVSLSEDEIEVIKELKNDSKIPIYNNEMMQVIVNILKNSQDNFTLNYKEHKKIIIRTKSTKDLVIMEIEDNGGGIDESIIASIFDPYFSTKEDQNGTGLGLHMSRIIITDHHSGKIYAKNTKEGVKFVVELPLKS